MTAADLLNALQHRGVILQVEGDRLRYSPVTAVEPELREQLREHKQELIGMLSSCPPLPARPADRPGWRCELACGAGGAQWRFRRPDAADRAYEWWKLQGDRAGDGIEP